MEKNIDWKPLLKRAYEEAKIGRDPSTQNAALLVDDAGKVVLFEINRFPDGIKYTKERLERPLKYKFSVDAEKNVCVAAARQGIKTEGLTMVCPWASCSDCAQVIIQSGIKRLVTHKQALDKSSDIWRRDIDIALSMLKEAGVEVVLYDGLVGVNEVLFSGQSWNP